MAILEDNLSYDVNQYPVLSQDTSGLLRRCEPIITPKKLVSRFLKGLDVENDFTTDELKDRINLAINETELLLGITVTRELFKEKVAFDQALYKKFIHIMVKQKPIVSLETLTIRSSNKVDIFKIPPTWIESARFYQGQVNVIPLTVVGATGVNQGSPTGAAGLVFIAAMNGGIDWVPAYWELEYTSGLSNEQGQVPIIVNQLIGTLAAIDILSTKGPQHQSTSVSVSHDGIGQSKSGPGNQLYRLRIEELNAKKMELVAKIKGTFSKKFFISNI